MSDPVDPPSDIEQVMAGRCIHGQTAQRDCLTCQMTRYLGVSLRRMTSALIAPGDHCG